MVSEVNSPDAEASTTAAAPPRHPRRIVTFAVPALYLSTQAHFQLVQLWYVSVASVAVQACFSLLLVRSEFRLRVPAMPRPASVSP